MPDHCYKIHNLYVLYAYSVHTIFTMHDSDFTDESNLTTKNTGIDNSSDEEFLNGYFDARVVHLYTNDDPSSSEEEQSDNENVYVHVCIYYAIMSMCVHIHRPLKDHPNSETSKSNMMVNHSSQLNTRKHDDSAEVSSKMIC